jgi:hypothetical protein
MPMLMMIVCRISVCVCVGEKRSESSIHSTKMLRREQAAAAAAPRTCPPPPLMRSRRVESHKSIIEFEEIIEEEK